jgi:hypothetical protein
MEINDAKLYFEKWNEILFSTQSINQSRAENAVKDAYHFCDVQVPKIYFFQSPLASKSLLENILFSADDYLQFKNNLEFELLLCSPATSETSHPKRNTEHWTPSFDRAGIFESLCNLIYQDALYSTLEHKNNSFFIDILESEFLKTDFWLYDFRMNCIKDKCNNKIWSHDLRAWNIFKSLCEECPFVLSFNDICIIINRPCELYLDRELLPHAEGKAAIRFRDGYEIYCNHGIRIPAKYGKIHPSNWQSEWIFTENILEKDDDLTNILLFNIGYKKFIQNFPRNKNLYWENHRALIFKATDIIIDWHFFHYENFYNRLDSASQNISLSSFQHLANSLPIRFSKELCSLYLSYDGEYQLAPKLYFYPFKQAIQNQTSSYQPYTVILFHGDRQEIYYVLCDNQERLISPVYCQFPGEEPIVYAECVTSLIVTIAQCYQEGAYYIAIDEETGDRTIEQDLDKIEPIFEKFNPDQIDNWRKIWKS